MTTDRLTSLRRSLRGSGRRLTGQRRLLLELIQEQPGHVDAHELYRLAQQRDPRISLATVYRTLGVLRELGLVDELHLGEEHHHYELKPARTHHHLVCLGCGQVIEFRSGLADSLEHMVLDEYGFEVATAQVDITGYCADCRAKRES